jgi:hypothetical protein
MRTIGADDDEFEPTLTLPDGTELTIVSYLDDDGEEVDSVYDATLIVAGTAELGYYEFTVEVIRPTTYH